MKLNQPENKFKHVVFGYSNFGKVVRMAKVSIELQNAGYTFYKRSNRWVLAERLTGEVVHTSANLTTLDYYLDKYIMPKVYLRDAKDIYEKYVASLKGEYDFNLEELINEFNILAVNLDTKPTALWNKVRECKTDYKDRVYNKEYEVIKTTKEK
tara:strand:+ start:573 stop:1034 length:462 start_codon:yes stop_codon:yes gene_type:complete